MTLLIRDVVVVEADGDRSGSHVDVVVDGERIVSVEPRGSTPVDAAATVIEGRGRLLMPGFVDAHAHVDGLVFDPAVQLALLRQGVTTVIGGQDGVSYAPGDGAYASEYFAAINGPHPSYRGDAASVDLPHTSWRTVPAGTSMPTFRGIVPS